MESEKLVQIFKSFFVQYCLKARQKSMDRSEFGDCCNTYCVILSGVCANSVREWIAERYNEQTKNKIYYIL